MGMKSTRHPISTYTYLAASVNNCFELCENIVPTENPWAHLQKAQTERYEFLMK
jgi:hypothetical protein